MRPINSSKNKLKLKISTPLDTESAFSVYVSPFFFFLRITDYVLFTGLTSTLFTKFFIKNGFHDTIHTFKNYFTTVFSVFSGIQMDYKLKFSTCPKLTHTRAKIHFTSNGYIS